MQLFNFARMCLMAGFLPCISGITLEVQPAGLLGPTQNSTLASTRNLAFLHVPYNFGHTVEKVAAFGNGNVAATKFSSSQLMTHNVFSPNMVAKSIGSQIYEKVLSSLVQEDGEVWATLHPNLTRTSSIGCPLSMTPPKYWPEDIARDYFGNKTVFGVLRDPYERLVAFFRGSAGGETGDGYGGDMSNWTKDCDVDGAINHMMKEYLSVRDKNPFIHGCTFLPQSEYFKGKYGIKKAVDNRKFPMSANRLFADHGYDFRIETADCMHVTGCKEIWSGTLRPDTREMIKEVYKEDFDLICSTFHYCDREENTCLQYVPQMCPKNMTLTGPNFDGSGTW